MRLAEFIPLNMEAILVQWEVFATSLHPAARNMTPLALRDHAQQILEAVVADLSTAQTRQAQADKSKGRQLKQVYGGVEMGVQERALRASVLRVWMDACQPDAPNLDDIIRFNEAIDQAVAESIGFFSAQVEQARNLLLGMLGHALQAAGAESTAGRRL